MGVEVLVDGRCVAGVRQAFCQKSILLKKQNNGPSHYLTQFPSDGCSLSSNTQAIEQSTKEEAMQQWERRRARGRTAALFHTYRLHLSPLTMFPQQHLTQGKQSNIPVCSPSKNSFVLRRKGKWTHPTFTSRVCLDMT